MLDFELYMATRVLVRLLVSLLLSLERLLTNEKMLLKIYRETSRLLWPLRY